MRSRTPPGSATSSGSTRVLAADLRADDSPEVDGVAHALFEGVRGRLDDLRVQAQLGAMEGQDLLTQLRAALDQLSSRRLH